MTGLLDRALDLMVIPGYSRIGYALRGLSWEDAVGCTLSGRVALVTGGGSGVGEAVCEGFAAAGARVHMLIRNRERGEAAISRIESRLPGAREAIELEVCDLSDLSSIRRLAGSFRARSDRLDLLVHNAGVLPAERVHTRDGVELTFATNVLGPFLLTCLLLPTLLAAAPSRVITVSSGGMYTARLRPGDLQLEDEPFDGERFYAHTKRAEVALNHSWAERFPADRIAFHAMHPGWVDTPGLRSSMPRFRRLMRPLLRDARQGADTIVWLGTNPVLERATGGFWEDRAPRPEHRLPSTRETAEDRERLWRECERLSTASEHPRAAAA
ncbi:MAG TPA: SDR family NAD(P)-dependent oxidoreductase [Solirubrobacterales bacterium]|nr:SDR family NAD(P)-dependent oxidoreductase [Solirubrobacterales bacterium]